MSSFRNLYKMIMDWVENCLMCVVAHLVKHKDPTLLMENRTILLYINIYRPRIQNYLPLSYTMRLIFDINEYLQNMSLQI